MEKHDGTEHDSDSSPTAALAVSTAIKPQARKLHDPDVSFEEYHFWALRTREEERNSPAPRTNWRELILRKKPAAEREQDLQADSDDKRASLATDLNLSSQANRLEITDEEWTNASRAFRTASWGACFYLIGSLPTSLHRRAQADTGG